MKGAGITLLVDAGNTRVKFGWMGPERGRREPGTLALAHEELGGLTEWMASLPAPPAAALGVSVAHAALSRRLDQLLAHTPAGRVHWLRSSARAAGVVNRYEQPETLGNDRWVALIGLSRHTRHTAMLASFGTATTIDTLSTGEGADARTTAHATERAFEGGMILPGPELMLQSLAKGTAGLPYALGSSTDFPRNTHSAIRTGVAAAQAGAVLRQWRTALRRLGAPARLYCTGGGWPLVADEVTAGLLSVQKDLGLPEQPPVWLDAPVLDGLAVLASEAPAPQEAG